MWEELMQAWGSTNPLEEIEKSSKKKKEASRPSNQGKPTDPFSGGWIESIAGGQNSFLDAIMGGGQESKSSSSSSASSSSRGVSSAPEISYGERITYSGPKDILETYGNVRIYRVPSEPVPIYEVSFPELTKEDMALIEEIRERLVVEYHLDPSTIEDLDERRRVIQKYVKRMLDGMGIYLPPAKQEVILSTFTRLVAGYGDLDPLVVDDNLEEIMVIGRGRPVYVWHRKYGMCKTNIIFKQDKDITAIIEKIARETGRRIDQQNPLLDARLADGSRVNATIPPISLDGPTLTIRKFKKDPLTIIDLLRFGSLPVDVAALLWLFVDGLGYKPANILIAGGTGSGKTTLLNSLAIFIPPEDRVISIEDTAEIQLPAEHWVRLETRPPNVEGKGEVTMDDLVKNSLRMRPDRIIVGEVRGPEAKTLFVSMNTGHDGVMGTLHANNARDTITRLTSPPMSVPTIMIPALDLIIMQARFHSRKRGTIRRVTEIAEVVGIEGNNVQLNAVFKYNSAKDTLEHTGVPIRFLNVLADHAGYTIEELMLESERRAVVLEYLVKNNIRDLKSVGEWIKSYYLDPDGTLKRIEAGGG